ncbi:MAG: UPF0175 family protein [Euryarchaeota archaeon]|nr:UPF0175 family protein [Euryarchaeota archaeon]
MFAIVAYVNEESNMETVAMRISKDLWRELEKITEIEALSKSDALRKMLEKGIKEWKKDLALQLLQQGKITLWKAAKMAEVTIWDMLDLTEKKGISLPIKAKDIIEDIKAGLKE